MSRRSQTMKVGVLDAPPAFSLRICSPSSPDPAGLAQQSGSVHSSLGSFLFLNPRFPFLFFFFNAICSSCNFCAEEKIILISKLCVFCFFLPAWSRSAWVREGVRGGILQFLLSLDPSEGAAPQGMCTPPPVLSIHMSTGDGRLQGFLLQHISFPSK